MDSESKKFDRKVTVAIVLVAAIILVAACFYIPRRMAVQDDLNQVANSVGLEDARFKIDYSFKYNVWDVTVHSDSFADKSLGKKRYIARKFDEVENVFVGNYLSAADGFQSFTRAEIFKGDEKPVYSSSSDYKPVSKPDPIIDTTTMGEKNALASAHRYLDTMAFSYSRLIEQLEFEGYTHEEAVYGADNCGANWSAQAAAKAVEYLNTMSFSREGLIEQLMFEGFTREQAEFGVTQAGY